MYSCSSCCDPAGLERCLVCR